MTTPTRFLNLVAATALCAGSALAQAPTLENMDVVLKSVPDGPVAKVNGRNIGAQDFIDLYRNELALEKRRGGDAGVSDGQRIRTALRCITILVQQEILHQEAQKRDLTITDEELEAGWEQLKRKMAPGRDEGLSDEEFLRWVGISREQALEDLRKGLLMEKISALIAMEKGVTVTDEETAEYFETHRQAASPPALCHIKQIFIKGAPGGRWPSEAKRETARGRAEDALKRIQAGQSFEAVAMTVSDGRGKEQGGDLGRLPIDQLPPFLAAAAQGLQPGGISDIIESEHGFHIIKLVEITPATELTLAQAAPVIRHILLAREGTGAVREFCKAVNDKEGAVEIYLELEKQLVFRPELLEELTLAP